MNFNAQRPANNIAIKKKNHQKNSNSHCIIDKIHCGGITMIFCRTKVNNPFGQYVQRNFLVSAYADVKMY